MRIYCSAILLHHSLCGFLILRIIAPLCMRISNSPTLAHHSLYGFLILAHYCNTLYNLWPRNVDLIPHTLIVLLASKVDIICLFYISTEVLIVLQNYFPYVKQSNNIWKQSNNVWNKQIMDEKLDLIKKKRLLYCKGWINSNDFPIVYNYLLVQRKYNIQTFNSICIQPQFVPWLGFRLNTCMIFYSGRK